MRIPDGFTKLKGKELKRYETAPCGPAKAFWGYLSWLVPDDLLGLPIQKACGIHDFEYEKGKTKADKIRADHNLLYNILWLIVQDGERVLERTILAIIYFAAVRFFGGGAFKGA